MSAHVVESGRRRWLILAGMLVLSSSTLAGIAIAVLLCLAIAVAQWRPLPVEDPGLISEIGPLLKPPPASGRRLGLTHRSLSIDLTTLNTCGRL